MRTGIPAKSRPGLSSLGLVRLAALFTVVIALVAAATASAMTRDQALALAQTVSLRAEDMPGYDASPAQQADPRADARTAKCGGTVPSTKALANYSSDDFMRSSGGTITQINSDIEVFPSPSLVRKDLRAAATKRARRCLAKELLKHGGDRTTKVLRVSIALLRPGIKNGLGYRVRIKFRRGGETVTTVTDALVRRIGPVEAGVIATSTGKAVSRARENDLLTIVSSRVADYLKAMQRAT